MNKGDTMPVAKEESVKASNLGKRPSTIYRHSVPTILDQHPRGTECRVGPEGSQILYIQNAQDENSPCWELMGPCEPSTTF